MGLFVNEKKKPKIMAPLHKQSRITLFVKILTKSEPASAAAFYTLQLSIVVLDQYCSAGGSVRAIEHFKFFQWITITETSVLNNFVQMHCENSVFNSPQHF